MAELTANQFDELTLTWSPQAAEGAKAAITRPDGETVLITASSASALPNVWTVYYAVVLPGTYSIAWSTLDGAITATDTLTVAPEVSAPLMTLTDCYLSLNRPVAMQGGNQGQDSDMLTYAAAAQRVVENIIGPLSGTVVQETFDGGRLSVFLGQRPTSILSIIENGESISDFVVDFGAGIIRAGTTWWNRPFWPGSQNVTVRYLAGGGKVQPNVFLAIREEFRFLWQIGRQGAGADPGQLMDASSGPGFAVPNRVYELLANERNLPGFA